MGDAVSRSMLRHAKRGLAPRRTESTKAALFLIAAAFLVVLPFVSAEVGGGPADAAATGAPVVAETKTQASAHIHVPVGKKENEQPRKSASGGTKLDAKKEDELDFALLGGVAAAVLIGAAGGVYLLCAGGSGKKKRRFKGDAIYLLGLCDAGKTSMLFLLRDGMQGGKLHETQTSQAPNEDTFVPSGAEGGALRVLDFPGHGRLRPQLFDIVEDCRAVIFLVDATTFSTNARQIAEFLLDLMTSTALLKHAERMLVVCNKTDALPDELAGISPKMMVKKRLETEIEGCRHSRSEGLDDIAQSMRVELEVAGATFRWSDSPLEVEFCDASAKEGSVAGVLDFLQKL